MVGVSPFTGDLLSRDGDAGWWGCFAVALFSVRLLLFGVPAVGAMAPRVVWDVFGVQLFIRSFLF
jgi:hypothetical protein